MKLISFEEPGDPFVRMIFSIYMDVLRDEHRMPYLSEVMARIDDSRVIDLAKHLVSNLSIEEAALIFDDGGEMLLSASEEDRAQYILRVSMEIISASMARKAFGSDFAELVADTLCDSDLSFIVDVSRLDFKGKGQVIWGENRIYGAQVPMFGIREWGEAY